MTLADLMTEDMLHIYTADVLRAFAVHGVIWWHTPNQNKHKVQYRVKLKKMGVRAGVPDFTIITCNTEGPRVAFLELKDADGGQRKTQEIFERDAVYIGVPYVIARTPEEVDAALSTWGAIKKPALIGVAHGGATPCLARDKGAPSPEVAYPISAGKKSIRGTSLAGRGTSGRMGAAAVKRRRSHSSKGAA